MWRVLQVSQACGECFKSHRLTLLFHLFISRSVIYKNLETRYGPGACVDPGGQKIRTYYTLILQARRVPYTTATDLS
ncbi:hypothetical protein RRG08_017751 [Elysia crispata]|uniref:Uncharacterized protein n=1 Tax=Elysia crispata TaxID=231223 RepID=A0AAE1CKW5_9GAST|nr:hypothetical protein RRG08_017751 [Elysia crispata]